MNTFLNFKNKLTKKFLGYEKRNGKINVAGIEHKVPLTIKYTKDKNGKNLVTVHVPIIKSKIASKKI